MGSQRLSEPGAKTLSIRFTAAQLGRLERAAEKAERTGSAEVRLAVDRHFGLKR